MLLGQFVMISSSSEEVLTSEVMMPHQAGVDDSAAILTGPLRRCLKNKTTVLPVFREVGIRASAKWLVANK